jgi:hypothetical protein
MAIETPSRYTYDLDGTTRVFFVPTTIKGEDYCRLEVDSTIINDRSKFDIVNNSIVFVDAADVPSGSQLDVLVVQSDESLGQLSITSNIDIVAQNIDNVNTVGEDINNVNTTANNTANINTVAGNTTNINQVASDTVAINEIYNNRAEIYQADTNAATATAQATIATTKASQASASASAAATQASNASASASSASSSATSASNSANAASSSASSASSSASTATTKASEASASATSAANSLATFQGQYTSSATEPTGSSEGDLWFDTVANELKVYKGSSFAALSGGQYYGDGAVKGIEYFAQSSVASDDIVIESTNNALSVESFTIEDGASVTVESGATWKVV